MSKLQEWIEAALIVADSNGMDDAQVIPTWPADVADNFPALTVGALREWHAAQPQNSERCPHAALEVMGNIQIDEGGELQTYYKALVITFASTEEIRRAIAAGKCTFSFKD